MIPWGSARATLLSFVIAAAPPPGPAPALTTAKAIADLRAAKILAPQIALASNAPISVQDFSLLLVRTVGLPAAAAPRVTASSTPATAVRALQAEHLTDGLATFANATQPISREDAVAAALSAAALSGMLHIGAVPAHYPPFADEAAFPNARERELAHRAVFLGLFAVGPDDRFRPTEPLAYPDAAYLLDAIRLSAKDVEKE